LTSVVDEPCDRTSDNSIPEGFALPGLTSTYSNLVGPLWERALTDDYRLGLRIDERHVDAQGVCEEALIMLVADVALGRAVAYARTPWLEPATVTLDLAFMAPARRGEWLEATGRIDRIVQRLAYASGFVMADGLCIARATGVFSV
jgi:acyl-coenzyme A thioesterase 13